MTRIVEAGMYKEILTFSIKKIVLKPEEVSIVELPGEKKVLEIHVAPEDRGRLIGREGRTIHALRTLLRAVASAEHEIALIIAQ